MEMEKIPNLNSVAGGLVADNSTCMSQACLGKMFNFKPFESLKTSYLIARKIFLKETWKNSPIDKPIKSMFSSNFEEQLFSFKNSTNPIPA